MNPHSHRLLMRIHRIQNARNCGKAIVPKRLVPLFRPSPGSTLIAFSSRNRTKFVINLVPIITNSTLTRGVLTNKGVDSQVSLTSAGLEERVQRAVMNGPMCNGAA